MNKRKVGEFTTMLVFSFLGIWVFNISPYLIVIGLLVAFYYLSNSSESELAVQSSLESKQLENQLKSKNSDMYLKQKQILTLISNLPMPLALLDEEGKIVLYNRYFEAFRQGNEEEDFTYLQNDLISDVKHFVSDAYLFERIIEKTMNVKGLEYQAMSIPITTKSVFSGCIVLFQDISKIKEREELQKKFIADASHELKTPISAIRGMIEILNREDFDDPVAQKDFLRQIEIENQRLENIVKDLLQLSRLSSGSFVLRREMLDFTKIIDTCIQTLQPIAAVKKIQIKKDYQSHQRVFVDRDKMEALVSNVLSNAVQYSDEGTILLSTKEEEDDYIFEIKDEGMGIPNHELQHIFERFYRVDQARSRVRGGSGLGLSIVKSIVDAHNAQIEIKSELGKGTTIKIIMKY